MSNRAAPALSIYSQRQQCCLYPKRTNIFMLKRDMRFRNEKRKGESVQCHARFENNRLPPEFMLTSSYHGGLRLQDKPPPPSMRSTPKQHSRFSSNFSSGTSIPYTVLHVTTKLMRLTEVAMHQTWTGAHTSNLAMCQPFSVVIRQICCISTFAASKPSNSDTRADSPTRVR